MSKRVCVLGSGAWGTVIASMLADKGNEVYIYGIVEEEINEINAFHTNKKFLNDFKINDSIIATLDFNLAIDGANIIVFAVPSFAIKETAKKIIPFINKKTLLVNLAKGFDRETKNTLGDVIRKQLPEEFKGNVVSLLGPSFAEEVAEKQFTAITASSPDEKFSRQVQKEFTNDYFRVYTNADTIGAEYCSSLKNVIALASGIADGLGFKVNTRAALITRGMAEIKRYVKHFGGNEETCFGLAGIGDLLLTCSSTTSRNYSAGYKIGSTSFEEFAKTNTKTVEGIFACEIAYEIAKTNGIYSPIVNGIYNVIKFGKNPLQEVKNLMAGELKAE